MMSDGSSDRAAVQAVYEQLMPLCLEFLETIHAEERLDPLISVQLQHLQHLLETLPPAGLNACVDQILRSFLMALPLGASDAPRLSGRHIEAVLSCVLTLVQAVGAPDFSRPLPRIQNTLAAMATLLSKSDNSEELQVLGVQILISMCSIGVEGEPPTLVAVAVPAFCVESVRALFGHAVSCLMHIAGHSRNRALQQLCLECLDLMFQASRSSDLVALVLPGVVSGLFPLTLGEFKHGSKVFVSALTCWSTVVRLTLADSACTAFVNSVAPSAALLARLAAGDFMDPAPTSTAPSESIPGSPEPWLATGAVPLVQRTAQWAKDTQERLVPLLMRCFAHCQQHPHPSVQVALCQLAQTCVVNCAWTLAPLAATCLEYLTSSTLSGTPAISSAASVALDDWRQHAPGARRQQAIVELEAQFQRAVLALPRIARTGNNSELVTALKHLSGVGTLLASRFDVVLADVAHELVEALCQCAELDLAPVVSILAPAPLLVLDSAQETALSTVVMRNPHPFRWLRDPEAIDAFWRAVGVFGRTEAASRLLEGLLGTCVARTRESTRCAAMFAISGVVVGCTAHTAEWLLQELLELWWWDLPTLSSAASSTGLSLQTIRANIHAVALLLDAVAACCQVLGGSLDVHIMHVLYKGLEYVGNTDVIVSQASMKLLKVLANQTHAPSIEALLHNNMDYIIDDVCIQLEYLTAPLSRTTTVLRAVSRVAGSAAIPLLKDVVDCVCRTLDAHRHTTHLSGLIGVLNVISDSLSDGIAIPKRSASLTPRPFVRWVLNAALSARIEPEPTETKDTQEFFTERARRGNDDNDDDDAQDNGAAAIDEADRQEASSQALAAGGAAAKAEAAGQSAAYNELVLGVLERAFQYVGAHEVQLACAALRTVSQCSIAIAHAQRQWLPVIASGWPSLMQALRHQDASVRCSACETMQILVVQCGAGDLLSARFATELWPAMSSQLRVGCAWIAVDGLRLADVPAIVAESSSLLPSANRHHLAALHLLSAAVRFLHLKSEQVESILQHSLHFLSRGAPSQLQAATTELYLALCDVDDGTVWYHLGCLLAQAGESTVTPAPASSTLPVVRFDTPSCSTCRSTALASPRSSRAHAVAVLPACVPNLLKIWQVLEFGAEQ